MKGLWELSKPGPGPGTYNYHPAVANIKADYKPVIVECFFKGAAKCVLCGVRLYGDYYRDQRVGRSYAWCVHCFRLGYPEMPRTYLDSIQKHRHCSFVHKHIDVENIVYHLIPKRTVRRLLLKEKAMWNKFGDMRDSKGRPAQ